MRPRIIMISLIFMGLFMSSCVKELDLDVQKVDSPKLMINGYITDQSGMQEIKVEWSSVPEGELYNWISDAEVVVTNDMLPPDNQFVFEHKGNGLYRSNTVVPMLVGQDYLTIEVTVDGIKYTCHDASRDPIILNNIVSDIVEENPNGTGTNVYDIYGDVEILSPFNSYGFFKPKLYYADKYNWSDTSWREVQMPFYDVCKYTNREERILLFDDVEVKANTIIRVEIWSLGHLSENYMGYLSNVVNNAEDELNITPEPYFQNGAYGIVYAAAVKKFYHQLSLK